MSLRLLKLSLIILGFGLCVYMFHQAGLTAWLSPDKLQMIVADFGVFGPIVFMGAYIIATVLFVPSSPLSLLSGVLFGPWYGTLYVIVSAMIGATLAFLLSRRTRSLLPLSGDTVLQERLRQYDERIAAHGFITVLVLRLLPIFPFNGLNFAFGLTRVRMREYVLGTGLGIIPGSFVLVYFGDSLASLNIVQIGIGLVLLIALLVIGKYFARRYS